MNDVKRNTQTSERPQPALLPPVDVIEDASGITLYADMPGVPRDKLGLRVEDDQLTLEGEIDLAFTEGLQSTHAELTLPRYRRAFTLSKELDAGKISAEFAQGVLRVRIPKAEHAQPRRIEVRIG
ncbi:MAG: heat-shock protein [Rubrivivax sp. SCN 71-131]|jgi:HSP20 family molecular chaperone IbpA|nr:MAG: heat-shock protein [Rubrivivax sp. SCN 71-131]